MSGGLRERRTTARPGRRNITLPSRHWLLFMLPFAGLVIVLAGGALSALETDTVGSLADGVWWSLSLVTTVGFVGGAPATTAGRAVAAFLMLFGFSLLAMTTAALASLFVREDEQPYEQRDAAATAEILSALECIQRRLDELERREA